MPHILDGKQSNMRQTLPAVYQTPALLGIAPMLVLVQRVPVLPSDYTGTEPAIGTIKPAL